MAGAGGDVDDPVGRVGHGVVAGAVMSRRRPSDCPPPVKKPLPVQKWLHREAVDLAVELEGYDGSVPVKELPVKETEVEAAKRLTREEVLKIYGVDLPQLNFPAAFTLNDLNGMRISTGRRVPLRQLQAQGFNTTPPPDYVDYVARTKLHTSLTNIGTAISKVMDEPDVGESGTPTPSPPT